MFLGFPEKKDEYKNTINRLVKDVEEYLKPKLGK